VQIVDDDEKELDVGQLGELRLRGDNVRSRKLSYPTIDG
jgi:hypothetical protein